MICIACGSNLRVMGDRQGWTYGRCGGCGAVQLMPIPDANELARRYQEDYHSSGHVGSDPAAHQSSRRMVCEQPASLIEALLPSDNAAPVLEVGAVWGALGVVLAERSVPFLGLEPNKAMRAHGRSAWRRPRSR